MAGKYDDMGFGKAFAAARKEQGGGKTFTWKGKSYSTNTKEDEAGKTASAPRPKARPSEMTTRSRSDSYESSGRGSEEETMRLAKKAREPRATAIYDAVRSRAAKRIADGEVDAAVQSAKSTMTQAREEMKSPVRRGRNPVRTGYADGGMVRGCKGVQTSGKAFRGTY